MKALAAAGGDRDSFTERAEAFQPPRSKAAYEITRVIAEIKAEMLAEMAREAKAAEAAQ